MDSAQKNSDIRAAAVIALSGNAVLAVLKILAGIFAHSGGLISDGIDSSADVLISLITLIVVRVISKPADAEHPWGHGRAETVTTAFLSFMLFFMGGQLILNALSRLTSNGQSEIPSSLAIIVSLISIAGKMLLAWCQYRLGKRANSAMIKANAKNMAGDVVISAGVLTGIVISTATDSALADTVIAGLIGIWIIKTAIGIFLEANLELMDGNRNTEPYRVIIDAVNSVEGAGNPHRARMRRVAGFWDIDLDIDGDPKCTISEAHNIACEVEDEIKTRLEDVYDIVIHVEPQGDTTEETFGLTASMIAERNNKPRGQ
ncbi:MAG: cation diffusion facilitator family transporter [Clostridiales bacterium]|jgi:cation diffusion facilitator family transporter|nr:cation diffusion facilitator family transporter [Clostridiales bacterium]